MLAVAEEADFFFHDVLSYSFLLRLLVLSFALGAINQYKLKGASRDFRSRWGTLDGSLLIFCYRIISPPQAALFRP